MKYSILQGMENLVTFLAGGFHKFCDYMDRASVESAELSLRAREPLKPHEIPIGYHLGTIGSEKLQSLIEDMVENNGFGRMA